MREHKNVALLPGGSESTPVNPSCDQHWSPRAVQWRPWPRLHAQDCVHRGTGCAVSRVLTDRASGAETKLSWPASLPTSTVYSLTPPQGQDIHIYAYYMDEWMSDEWNKAKCTVPGTASNTAFTLVGGNCYSSREGHAIIIKTSSSFLGTYPRDVLVHGWDDICMRLFYCSFFSNSKKWRAI